MLLRSYGWLHWMHCHRSSWFSVCRQSRDTLEDKQTNMPGHGENGASGYPTESRLLRMYSDTTDYSWEARE